jgi:DNA polymerase-3 subunit delta'
MAFKDFTDQAQAVQLLQRSLERGRLAHAYLFCGHQLEELESLARTLAKTLNCQQPIRSGNPSDPRHSTLDTLPVDCCDHCLNCRKIEHASHPDVHWLRPESKLRLIKIDQIVERPTTRQTPLLDRINLRAFEAEYKVAVIVAADRMNEEAANAFLKTLEEPPPKTILILLTTQPERVLETLRSRCLRLNFAGPAHRPLDAAEMAWLTAFSDLAAGGQKSLLGRYRLIDVLLRKLNELKAAIDTALKARSPLETNEDAQPALREKWEEELKAAIEAEFRRQRADLLVVLQRWLRDVWLVALEGRGKAGAGSAEQRTGELLDFPQVSATRTVAQRISAKEAMENLQIVEQLQRWLQTNVQEALALEVGVLKLNL